MPAEYTIDASRRLVRSRAWGTLTYVEATRLQNALLADPAFDKTYNELIDWREIEHLVMSTEELRVLARPHIFGEGTRRAAVHSPDRPVIRGIVRMFEAFRDSSGGRERIRVFDNLGAALTWLNGS
jgi:hypothetical protein